MQNVSTIIINETKIYQIYITNTCKTDDIENKCMSRLPWALRSDNRSIPHPPYDVCVARRELSWM